MNEYYKVAKRFLSTNLGITIVVAIFFGVLAISKQISQGSSLTESSNLGDSNNYSLNEVITEQSLNYNELKNQLSKMKVQLNKLRSEQQEDRLKTERLSKDKQMNIEQLYQKIDERFENNWDKYSGKFEKKPYQVLGTVYTQDANVWAAKILYDGQVLTLLENEHMGGWMIVKVSENAVIIN